ncbi:MAG: hypothetical protein J7J67_02580, partial [Thermoproteales archaeon]|nr:hypothetical protein [Thermoproteales archaeon]
MLAEVIYDNILTCSIKNLCVENNPKEEMLLCGKHRGKSIRRIIIVFTLLTSLFGLPLYKVSTFPSFRFTLLIANIHIEGLLPVMKISNYSTLVFSDYCDLGFSIFEKNEKRVLINLSSPLNII